MNITQKEKLLVIIIRYFLPIFIIFITILASILVTYEHKSNIQTEKEYIKNQYITDQKELIKSDLKRVYNYIKNKEKNTKENLQIDLKSRVNNAYSILNSIYENNKDKKTKKEIIEQIKYALKDIRFSKGKGYFFIFTMNANTILNSAFPKLNGMSLWNHQDAKGTFIFQDMKKLLKNKNEVYYDWYWKDPLKKDEGERLKIGYFKKFEPYGLYIGTGFYYEDYVHNLKDEVANYISKLRYKDDRYVFIIDEYRDLIVSKHESILNINIQEYADGDFWENSIDKLTKNKSREDGLYVEYGLNVDELDEPIKKISYLLYFENWDWVLGTGFELSSINATIKQKQNYLEEKYKTYLNNIFLIGFIFVFFLLILSYFISKYIEKSFFNYTSDLEEKQDLLLKAHEVGGFGNWEVDTNSMTAIWSDSIIKIFGIEKMPEKVGPEFLKTIMHKEDWKCFESSMYSAIKEHKEHKCTYRIIKPDSSIVWIDCKGEYDSRTNKIVGTIQDITERMQFEIDKHEKEKIIQYQSKMAAMGEMIGNIAHQWRQPLSVISTASTGIKLKKEMGELSDEDLLTTMDSINNSTQYLSQTIDDFRNFFNPAQQNYIMVSIEDVIDSTLNLVHAQYVSKGITIIKNIEDISLKTSKNGLIQVLINILNNSRDVLAEQKKQKKFIFINSFKKSKDLLIEIYDNGNGIDEKIINRIFEPYFTTKYKSQGTGIGLFMSQEIIEKQLNGTIVAENYSYNYEGEDYTGAKFTIKISLS
ncbi:MAG: cache domain-containing protein [Arcobacter sp.]|uniref:cache domain-containing protein n=1 Tax=Arcobacter sp. TaxID=1872629 RepID=UPI003B0037CC